VLQYALPEHLKARQEAQRSERVVQIVAMLSAVVCIVAAAMLTGPINDLRRKHQLIIDPQNIKGLPPDIALANKLGTFRALAIDWASIRADRLKEQGKMYEALELHELICRLQPRFPNAWVNAAWNMAYNISVTQYSPEARWKWVNNGVKLLRDQGLQWNPRSVTIYKELAWIYWHKMGDFLDDEHRAYRRMLALEMEAVIGPPPPIMSDEEYMAWFRRIVDAPQDFDAYVAENPEAQRLLSQLESLKLTVKDFLRQVAFAQRLGSTTAEFIDDARVGGAAADPHEAFYATIARDFDKPPMADFIAAARSRILREEMKLKLEWMYGCMERYGPIDWRSPFAHSLYWSDLGNEETKGQANLNPADSMNTARLVANSLQGLVAKGRLISAPNFDEPLRSYLEEGTDTRFIPRLREAYDRLVEEQWHDTPGYKMAGVWGTSFRPGYVARMHEWIQLLYLEGGERNLALAREYLLILRDHNPHPDSSIQEQYAGTLDDFVTGNIISSLQTNKMASPAINSLIMLSLKQLSNGDRDQAIKSMERARLCWDIWMSPAAVDFNDRRKIEDLKILYRDGVIRFIVQSPQYDPAAKSRLWRSLELQHQQRAWDSIAEYVKLMCEHMTPPWDAAKAFPEPPGMEAFRKQNQDPAPLSTTGQSGAEQGTRYRN
jgi:hypothetical protein